ncbi:hypothetical protein HDU96_005407 [Phlyctochytrium bullatum]|nr:hypothetical protein HDU96_005407 [Phlyctochytrium bullatum]
MVGVTAAKGKSIRGRGGKRRSAPTPTHTPRKRTASGSGSTTTTSTPTATVTTQQQPSQRQLRPRPTQRPQPHRQQQQQPQKPTAPRRQASSSSSSSTSTPTTSTSSSSTTAAPSSSRTIVARPPPPVVSNLPPRPSLTLPDIVLAYFSTSWNHSPPPPLRPFITHVIQTVAAPSSLVHIALLYLSRLRSRHPTAILGADGGAARVFLAALVAANKMFDDARYTNRVWADVAGIELARLNALEAEFLAEVGWALHVREDEYGEWVRRIGAMAAAAVGYQKGQPLSPVSPVSPWGSAEGKAVPPTTVRSHVPAAAWW